VRDPYRRRGARGIHIAAFSGNRDLSPSASSGFEISEKIEISEKSLSPCLRVSVVGVSLGVESLAVSKKVTNTGRLIWAGFIGTNAPVLYRLLS
jgi:hypothetical protein